MLHESDAPVRGRPRRRRDPAQPNLPLDPRKRAEIDTLSTSCGSRSYRWKGSRPRSTWSSRPTDRTGRGRTVCARRTARRMRVR
ncbi:hypothetical protein DXU03_30655 [Rhizobium johnstonii]